jgi:hypothetical protein
MDLIKHNRRKEQRQRVLTVFALSKFYSDYREIYLLECLLKLDNNYTKAEETSAFINSIFNGNTTPSEFMKNHEEIINELIDKNKYFNLELDRINQSGTSLNKKNVLAFCKLVEHGSFHLLKINLCFNSQVNFLLHYIDELIPKEALLIGMMETSFIDGRRKKNNVLFKKTFLAIEKTYYEVFRKQLLRTIKN